MKKTISILVASLIFLNLFSGVSLNIFKVKAASNVVFTVGQISGCQGDTVSVNIDISASSYVSAATLRLSFDTTKLDYVSAEAGSALDGGLSDINPNGSTITLAYINTTGLKNAGTIMTVEFNIKVGLTAQTIPLNFEVLELVDKSENILPSTITQGAVIVQDIMRGDVDRNGSITAVDALMALQLSSGRLAATVYTTNAADVDKSGTITAIDALKILQFASGRITTFDPTPTATPIPSASPTLSPTPSPTPSPSPSPTPDPGIPAVQWVANELTFTSSKNYADTQVVGGTNVQSTFESATVPTDWSAFGGAVSTSFTVAHSGSKSLRESSRLNTWDSAAFNLYNTFKANGAGTYDISFWVYVDALATSPTNASIMIRGNAADVNSFITATGGQYYTYLKSGISTTVNTWVNFTATLTVLSTDLTRASGTFNLMLDALPASTGQNIYFDDFTITKESTLSAFNDVTMDATFTGPNSTVLTMPAFWNGGNTWKVRFAPTLTGIWTYNTVCNDTTDTGLNNQTGKLNCSAYTGSLDIYKHGFVKTVPNTRYFEYNDGTPFFYLGDTHWSMPSEPYYTSSVANIPSQFKYIVDKRVIQGFTVYQSEPLGAQYDLSNGFTSADLAGFADLDNRFKYIADAGLVHANAQFFFVTELSNNAADYSTAYLDKLSRYWVARYGAYPVMWTTAQECDKNCYGAFDTVTNPWKSVLQSVNSYDPYKHPSTAHQENTGTTIASTSTFKDLSGYKWFGAQWAATKNGVQDFTVPKDYYNNSGVRPVVDYEGHYQNLWTNEYGARMQGWTAYLNGMFGQGYGAEDIWLYNSTYDMDADSTVYGITVTVADKQVKWDTSVEFAAAYQLGYMHNFFNSIAWWNLVPRFDSSSYFTNSGSWYSVASIDNSLYVAYFYNNTTRSTGTLRGLANVQYTAQWFNPLTGVYNTATTVTVTNARYTIGNKPDNNDWVLLFKKV